jgi:hypothetical protein
MKYALICPNEPVLDGYRVAQIEEVVFPVAEPLYWLECADNVTANDWYFKDGVYGEVASASPPVVNKGTQSL